MVVVNCTNDFEDIFTRGVFNCLLNFEIGLGSRIEVAPAFLNARRRRVRRRSRPRSNCQPLLPVFRRHRSPVRRRGRLCSHLAPRQVQVVSPLLRPRPLSATGFRRCRRAPPPPPPPTHRASLPRVRPPPPLPLPLPSPSRPLRVCRAGRGRLPPARRRPRRPRLSHPPPIPR
jgi:hypothetical protein